MLSRVRQVVRGTYRVFNSYLRSRVRTSKPARRSRLDSGPAVSAAPTASPLARYGVALLAVAFTLGFLTLAVRALSPDVRLWLTGELEQPGQTTVFNNKTRGGHFGMPVELGDYDGDGHVDLAIAPMGAHSGPDSDRQIAGEVYVYPGDGSIGGVINRDTVSEEDRGLTLLGRAEDDMLGTELFTADVNGDQIDDLLLSAQNYDHSDGDDERDNCGAVYVVLGRAGLLDGGVTLDLADPLAEGVLQITGAEGGDRFGIWVEAGDLDGDGFSDIIVGADQWPNDSTGQSDTARRGKVYVIYGRASFPASIDLVSFDDQVTTLHGRDPEDHFGGCLHSRDLDGDGKAELIIAAAMDRLSASISGDSIFPSIGEDASNGPDNSRLQCGEVYVFHSSEDNNGRLPATIDLSQDLEPSLAARMTTIYGADDFDSCGEEITTGDFNGDGWVDLALGALGVSDADGNRFVGGTYVVYWQPGLGGTSIDLNDVPAMPRPEGLRISTMIGARALDILGDTLSAGDFDQDGLDDLAIGIPHFDVSEDPEDSREDTGAIALVFGQTEPLPELWFPQADTLPEALRVQFVIGAGPGDLLSYSMEARDIDGDGYDDLFPNAMRGDGFLNGHLSAGEAVAISGYHLSAKVLQLDGVTPSSGVVGLPVDVVLEGDGFTRDGDISVFLGDQQIDTVRVLGTDRIEVTLPGDFAAGSYPMRVVTRHGEVSLENAFTFTGEPIDGFIRGDSNISGAVDLSDAVHVLSTLFLGAATLCADASDANDDSSIDLTDGVYILRYLFQGTTAPPAPFPTEGLDPTEDELDCATTL